MQITINDIIKLQPCSVYTPERLEELAAGRTSVTPAEIAELDIPADDRLWVLTQLMTTEQQDRYARRVARSVLHLWDAPDVVRRWLRTGDPKLRPATAATVAVEATWAAAEARDVAREADYYTALVQYVDWAAEELTCD